MLMLLCVLQLKEEKQAKRAKLAAKTMLSFAADDEDEEQVPPLAGHFCVNLLAFCKSCFMFLSPQYCTL